MDTRELISQARDLTGESLSGARTQFPTIKFMGRTSPYGEAGKYYMVKQKDGEINSQLIGDKIEVTILRIRKTLNNGESNEKSKYVYEFDSTQRNEQVFLKIGKGEPIQMSFSELRKQHPDLKYIEILYVAYGKQICKLKVSGGSLGNFFDYLKTIPYNDTVMRYKTLLSSEEKQHDKGNYFAITFTRGEVDSNFAEYITSIKQISFQRPPSIALPPAQEEMEYVPTEKEPEINVDDMFGQEDN